MKRELFTIGATIVALLLVVFIIWRLNLAHEVNRELAAIRAAGLPTSGAELNTYYKDVPDDQNAAVVMEQAFVLLQKYPDTRSKEVEHLKLPPRRQSLTAEQRELLAGYVEMNSNALSKVDEAIKLPHTRYPIDLSWGVSAKLPHLDGLKTLALLEEFRAFVALDANQPTNATAAIVSILGMAHTLDDEPVMISKLVRMAMLNIATITLERRINDGNLPELECKDLETALFVAAKTNQIIDGFVGDRAMTIPYFRMSWADIKKYSDSDDGDGSAGAGPQTPGPRPIIFRVTGFFERDLLFYLQAMKTNISLAEMPPPKSVLVSNVQEEINTTSRKNLYILSSLMLPALNNIIATDAAALARARIDQVALKIEQYRLLKAKLPDTLNDLVPQFLSEVPQDPFDGKPIRFHHLAKGYVVYSVGKDGHDNNGRERPDNVKLSDRTEYDITFTVER